MVFPKSLVCSLQSFFRKHISDQKWINDLHHQSNETPLLTIWQSHYWPPPGVFHTTMQNCLLLSSVSHTFTLLCFAQAFSSLACPFPILFPGFVSHLSQIRGPSPFTIPTPKLWDPLPCYLKYTSSACSPHPTSETDGHSTHFHLGGIYQLYSTVRKNHLTWANCPMRERKEEHRSTMTQQ
jgi:hypothetical protein